MSTNCISCVVNKRYGGDLLCSECRATRNQQLETWRKYTMTIREIIKNNSKWEGPSEDIPKDATLQSLGVDSIDMLGIVHDIEEFLHTDIPDEQLDTYNVGSTVEQIINASIKLITP